MKAKHLVLLAGLAVGVLFLPGWGRGQAKPPDKKTPSKIEGPLIWKHLLPNPGAAPAVTKRDIFTSQGPGFPSAGSDSPSALRIPETVPGAVEKAEEAALAENAPQLNVRYVGYILGKQKTIALILSDTQALAVGEGETFGQAWTVMKVTATEIEIRGADGKTQTVPLEGVRK